MPGTESLTDKFQCASCNLDLNIGEKELTKRVSAVSVKDFMDTYTFDVKKVMKCCVEIITPDGRMIPFCSYNNVGYREQVREAMSKEYARERLE